MKAGNHLAGVVAEHSRHLPRAPNGRLTFLAGYARYASRLPLNYLAFGDPHSLTGVVRRWNDLNRDRRLQPGEVGRGGRRGRARAARTAGPTPSPTI